MWPLFASSTGNWYKYIENRTIEVWPKDDALLYAPALKDTPRDDLAPAQFVAGWYLGASNSSTFDDGFR